MKTAKLGAIFMISVMALAGLGVGYAHWKDDLTILVKADMGRLGFGFTDQWTDDSGPNYEDEGGQLFPDPEGEDQGYYDPDCPEGEKRVCGKSYPPLPLPQIKKNVASTNYEFGPQKKWHNGDLMYHEWPENSGNFEPVYGTIIVTLNNTYPNYAPNLHFNISNAGCVPVDIVGHWLIDDGIDGNGIADGIDEPGTWKFMYKCQMYPIDLNGDKVPDIEIGLFCRAKDQQIDPCEKDEYGVSFHILQDYPPCTTLTFELKLYGVQWNWPVIPPYTPTEPPLPPIP